MRILLERSSVLDTAKALSLRGNLWLTFFSAYFTWCRNTGSAFRVHAGGKHVRVLPTLSWMPPPGSRATLHFYLTETNTVRHRDPESLRFPVIG